MFQHFAGLENSRKLGVTPMTKSFTPRSDYAIAKEIHELHLRLYWAQAA